jgi:hypothetical protein
LEGGEFKGEMNSQEIKKFLGMSNTYLVEGVREMLEAIPLVSS